MLFRSNFDYTFSFSISSFFYGDNGGMDSLRQEKVYVHMDKPFYLVGDTIWMKGYLVDARTHRNRMSGAVFCMWN